MRRSAGYKTKQREAVLNYIASLEGAHITAAQIVAHFEKEAAAIGRTTVYRHLDRLTENGKVRKYITDGISGACYQYIGQDADRGGLCHGHLHLKCERCGELQHLECDSLSDLQRHVFDRHAFSVNALKTVLYGKCDKCMRTEEGAGEKEER